MGKAWAVVLLKATEHQGGQKGFQQWSPSYYLTFLSWETSSNAISLQVVFMFQKFLKAFSSVVPSIEQSYELFSITDDCI